MIDLQDTIAAISTAPGVAAVGLIRTSGPASRSIIEKLVPSSTSGDGIVPRILKVGWVVDPSTGEKADKVMYSFLQGPATYTGEDMLELHGHGGRKNMERLLSLVLQAGARVARPGEFTMRAFLRGKMDLVQAEAVLSVVNARNEKALRIAQRELRGILSREIEAIRDLIVSQLAAVEASIDFPEDAGEIGADLDVMEGITKRLGLLLGKWGRSRRLASGLQVVLTGRPNSGKSSLMNRILGRDRCIVDPRPGTTRDYIEATLEIEGCLVTLVDTAGLREEGDRVELLGMEAARELIGTSDVVLLLIDESGISTVEVQAVQCLASGGVIIPVLSKCDLGWSPSPTLERLLEGLGHPPVRTSAVTGEGVATLESKLVDEAGGNLDTTEPLLTSTRHFQCVKEAAEEVKAVLRLQREGAPLDLVAAHLKSAVASLDEMTGKEVAVDLLDAIFSRFCIGK